MFPLTHRGEARYLYLTMQRPRLLCVHEDDVAAPKANNHWKADYLVGNALVDYNTGRIEFLRLPQHDVVDEVVHGVWPHRVMAEGAAREGSFSIYDDSFAFRNN